MSAPQKQMRATVAQEVTTNNQAQHTAPEKRRGGGDTSAIAARIAMTDAVIVTPVTITDRNCAALTGLEPRPWRAAVVALGVPATRLGKRLVVCAEDWAAAVRGHRDEPVPEHDADVEPTREEIHARISRGLQ